MNYTKKHLKKDYENKVKVYRDEDVEEKEKMVNEKLSKLPIHQLITQIKLCESSWDSDAVCLYPSALLDEKSVYPRIETVYAFTKVMNDEIVKKFNNPTFNQGSAILKVKNHNPSFLIVQHLPVKEKVKK